MTWVTVILHYCQQIPLILKMATPSKRVSVLYLAMTRASNCCTMCFLQTTSHWTIVACWLLRGTLKASLNMIHNCTRKRRSTRTLGYEKFTFLFLCIALHVNGYRPGSSVLNCVLLHDAQLLLTLSLPNAEQAYSCCRAAIFKISGI
jgi:hypothetical protein